MKLQRIHSCALAAALLMNAQVAFSAEPFAVVSSAFRDGDVAEEIRRRRSESHRSALSRPERVAAARMVERAGQDKSFAILMFDPDGGGGPGAALGRLQYSSLKDAANGRRGERIAEGFHRRQEQRRPRSLIWPVRPARPFPAPLCHHDHCDRSRTRRPESRHEPRRIARRAQGTCARAGEHRRPLHADGRLTGQSGVIVGRARPFFARRGI